MLVGLIAISVIVGAGAGGAALIFGNGLLVSLIVYSLTASTVLLLLALWSYSRHQEKPEKVDAAKYTRIQST